MIGVSIEMRTLGDEVRRNGAMLLQAQARVPVCTGGAPERSRVMFNRHYLDLAQSWLSDARGPKAMAALRHRNRNYAAGVEFAAHTEQLNCEVTYNTQRMLSVVCDIRRAESAVHEVSERRAETWDMAVGRIVTMRELFQPGTDYLKTIFDYIERFGRVSTEQAQALRAHFRQRDFYLTRKGLVVFFPLAEQESYPRLPQAYAVPYEEFEGLSL